MSFKNPQGLVSTQWLAQHMNAPDVHIIDATYFMPTDGKNAHACFEESHIPGAQFFNIDDISDSTQKNLPHMVPSAEKFSSRVRKLGWGDGVRLVIYDSRNSCCAAARVWWMFRLFGHEDVAVLDGGLGKWIAEGREIDDGPADPVQDRHFSARMNNFLVRDKAHMLKNIEKRREQVVDARSVPRFRGEVDEPWPGSKVGHIPNSLNVPFNLLIDPDKGNIFRTPDEMRAIFDQAGVDPRKPLVATCGSGVTASVLAFCAYLLGNKDAAVYDGSWAEWGAAKDTPVEKTETV